MILNSHNNLQSNTIKNIRAFRISMFFFAAMALSILFKGYFISVTNELTQSLISFFSLVIGTYFANKSRYMPSKSKSGVGYLHVIIFGAKSSNDLKSLEVSSILIVIMLFVIQGIYSYMSKTINLDMVLITIILILLVTLKNKYTAFLLLLYAFINFVLKTVLLGISISDETTETAYIVVSAIGVTIWAVVTFVSYRLLTGRRIAVNNSNNSLKPDCANNALHG